MLFMWPNKQYISYAKVIVLVNNIQACKKITGNPFPRESERDYQVGDVFQVLVLTN